MRYERQIIGLCSRCGSLVENVSEDADSVVCWMCVQSKCLSLSPFEPKIYKRSDKPRGWHLKKVFVDKSGSVYHRGKEQPDLKGTLQPTIIKKKIKANSTNSKYVSDTIDKKAIRLEKQKRLIKRINKAKQLGDKVTVKKLKVKLKKLK